METNNSLVTGMQNEYINRYIKVLMIPIPSHQASPLPPPPQWLNLPDFGLPFNVSIWLRYHIRFYTRESTSSILDLFLFLLDFRWRVSFFFDFPPLRRRLKIFLNWLE